MKIRFTLIGVIIFICFSFFLRQFVQNYVVFHKLQNKINSLIHLALE